MASIPRSFVFVILLTLCFALPIASATTCTNSSLNGVYGWLATGLNGSLVPAASLTQATFNGAGSVTGSTTKSKDGTILTYTFTGTYSIASNCTGILSVTNETGQLESTNFVLNNLNKGAFGIQTVSNHVQTAVAASQGTATCTDKGVKHTYSVELTGTDLAIGQIGAVGQFVLNGTGSISGTLTLSLYGTIVYDASVTGTYTINSNCTGTAQITPQGVSTINLSLVVLSTDKEIMAIETDANTVISGILLE